MKNWVANKLKKILMEIKQKQKIKTCKRDEIGNLPTTDWSRQIGSRIDVAEL